jgi:hypothetical protein
VITLFAILVLLMQFPNILYNVKRDEEEGKEEESQKERIMK